MDELRIAARSSPCEPMGGVQIIAPVGAGKTEAAKIFARRANTNAEEGTSPVALVTLNSAGTTKSIPVSILSSLGEPRPDRGSESVLWMRARRCLSERKVELLVLDEMDRAARRPTIRYPIASSLRDLADEGSVPLAFICTEKSNELFRNAPDLSQRLYSPVILHPFDWLIDDDRQLILDLVRGFDEGIANAGILPQESGLAQTEIVEKLAIASNGILRQLQKIIGTALANVVRRGDQRIDVEDLRDAVDDWSIAKRYISDNPFGTG
ncbi:MAG: ATP-binding protein [Nitrobacter sp.]|uniref:ATP-binding protein n=1 Tax=Nitrobacter sp. TaxID=29420 RepID=UPI00262D5EB8|nr:ATP-binding protein [Nitrobacter sp.]MCV0386153.1 ATP-binding protein [Nitrobacter sp.]